jgi:hypothetical protein
MITDSFDNKSPAIINPVKKENAIKVDNENNDCGQHDAGHFNIALTLAEFILQ